MNEPPAEVADADVLRQVRRSWGSGVNRVRYLPVGFGAHHWTGYAGGTPLLFVTYDSVAGPDALADLEAAYDGAVALRETGLEFVLAPVETRAGRVLVPFAGGALSCTPWRAGTSEEPLDLPWTREVLRRLHDTAPPAGLPTWRPAVGSDFVEATVALTERTWGPGPYADRAREAVRAHLDDIARWTDRYGRLAGVAGARPWVITHGEPHHANQLHTTDGRFLVDWDTLKLAPAELDLRVLVDAGLPAVDVGADPQLLEMFDLEWRLDEIKQYAAWFAAPHTGTRDDEIAFDGMEEELTRPEPSW